MKNELPRIIFYGGMGLFIPLSAITWIFLIYNNVTSLGPTIMLICSIIGMVASSLSLIFADAISRDEEE